MGAKRAPGTLLASLPLNAMSSSACHCSDFISTRCFPQPLYFLLQWGWRPSVGARGLCLGVLGRQKNPQETENNKKGYSGICQMPRKQTTNALPWPEAHKTGLSVTRITGNIHRLLLTKKKLLWTLILTSILIFLGLYVWADLFMLNSAVGQSSKSRRENHVPLKKRETTLPVCPMQQRQWIQCRRKLLILSTKSVLECLQLNYILLLFLKRVWRVWFF